MSDRVLLTTRYSSISSKCSTFHLRTLPIRGIQRLTAQRSLRGLDLYNTEITDRGLERLATVGTLKWLQLTDTHITDAGIHPPALTKLESLDLAGTEITDAGMASLEPLTALTRLTPIHTSSGDTGRKHIAGVTKLRELRSSQIATDKGLESLGDLKGLVLLDLDLTAVSDAGLRCRLDALTRFRRWTFRARL